MKRLIDIVNEHDRRLIVPLMGFPGCQITRSSLKQNEFNWGLQFWTLYELAKRFEPDGIFTFMDLAVEANALGLPVRFPLRESPTVEHHPVRSVEDLNEFLSIDPLKDGRVRVYLETMKLLVENNVAPLKGGYVIGPFTLAGLMMGASYVALAVLDDSATVTGVLSFCTNVIARYAQALVDSGADMIAILEPTGVILSPDQFMRFSGRFITQIVAKVNTRWILHICGNSTHLLQNMCLPGIQGLSLDSLVDFPKAARNIPSDVVLIGNIDPVGVMREMKPGQVRSVVKKLMEDMAPYDNFVLSTGCDLPPETPLENIQAFMDAGREFGRRP